MLFRKKERKSRVLCIFFPLKERKVNLTCTNADTVAQLTPGWLNSLVKRFFKINNANTIIFFTTFIVTFHEMCHKQRGCEFI